jgi:hypothetical protein
MKNLLLDPAVPATGGAPVTSTADNIANVATNILNEAAPIANALGPDGQLAVVAATAALAAYKGVLALVDQLAAKGVMTAAQQQAVYDNHMSLETGTFFSTPQWQITP